MARGRARVGDSKSKQGHKMTRGKTRGTGQGTDHAPHDKEEEGAPPEPRRSKRKRGGPAEGGETKGVGIEGEQGRESGGGEVQGGGGGEAGATAGKEGSKGKGHGDGDGVEDEVGGVSMDQDKGVGGPEGTKGAEGESVAPVILFAHGAGAGKDSPWMLRWRHLLEEGSGASSVSAFDYPYLSGGKKGAPPKAEKLVGFHLAQVKDARSLHPGAPIVLCGKSMGSRVGAMVAAIKEAHIKGVICFGYPIRGVNGASRAHTLQAVPCPLLLIQGSKDSLGPLDEIRSAIKGVPQGMVTLFVVEGGDHSLTVPAKVLKAQQKTQKDVDNDCLQAVKAFLGKL